MMFQHLSSVKKFVNSLLDLKIRKLDSLAKRSA